MNQPERFALLVCLSFYCALSLTGCDKPPPASKDQGSNDSVEAIRITKDAADERTSLAAITDSAVRSGAQSQIAAAGYQCPAIDDLWSVNITLSTPIKIMKVQCEGAGPFQLTLFDNKGFVKPWTGILMGN